MKPSLRRIRLWASALVFAAAPVLAQPLVTEEEARLPDAKNILTRSVTRAPGIKLVSPEAGSAKTPFNLKIAFEPRGGASIVPASVKLTYLKAPLVDLTERVKAGISAKGIESREVQMPAGEHQMRVSVSDDEGRNTSSVIKLTISN